MEKRLSGFFIQSTAWLSLVIGAAAGVVVQMSGETRLATRLRQLAELD